MAHFGEIAADTLRAKLKLFMDEVAELVCDNDEAVHRREIESLAHGDGYAFDSHAPLSYYWSTGTGTPMLDKLIERLIEAQAAEWSRQYPNRAGLIAILLNDEGEFREEAEEWELAALNDESVFIRIEAVIHDGRIKFFSCFCNEVNQAYGTEWTREIDAAEFLVMEAAALEALANEITEAPYKARL